MPTNIRIISLPANNFHYFCEIIGIGPYDSLRKEGVEEIGTKA